MSSSFKVIISKNYKKKDRKYPLYLQVIVNREKKWFALDLKIEEEKFIMESGLVNSMYEEAGDYNIIINRSLTKANEIFRKYRIKEEPISLDIFNLEYTRKTSTGDFLQYYADRLKYRIEKKLIEKNTIKGERTTLNKLKGFKKKMLFKQITPALVDDFNIYMLKRNNKQNTRWGNFKHFKSYFYEAVEEGLADGDPFKKLDVNLTEGPITYIHQEELLQLIAYYYLDEIPGNEKKVLKYFLFSCFSGLRISDVGVIDDENLVGDFLVFVPVKTKKKGKFIRIPLSSQAKRFISMELAGKLFDTYTDQTTNKLLKRIALKMEIKKRITFHVARHSFATLFLELGGKIEVLQEFLGHTKITTTRRYVHVSEKRKQLEISVFDQLMIPARG